MGFVPLHVHSAFSFGDGADGVDALVLRASQIGVPALALSDTMRLSGIPGLVRACAKAGIHPIGGAEIVLEGGHTLTLLADGPTGWASLCRILTRANLRDEKRVGARVRWEELAENTDGLVCLSGAAIPGECGEVPSLIRRRRYAEAKAAALRHLALFGRERYRIEVTRTLTEGEPLVSHRLLQLAEHLHVAAVATNPVHHATKAGLAAHEALRRVRLRLSSPHEQHADLPLNGEGYLKTPEQMAALFADRPDVLENTVRLAESLSSPLDPDARHLPRFPSLPPGESAFSYLATLSWQGARERYGGGGAKGEVSDRLVHELETIRDLGYCDYFLVCWDVCQEAKRRQIGHGLRGSAIGSAVAYCLGMSPHDPIARRVSFERFLSKARKKPPDIDIDFRHDERDAMMTYVRTVYGDEKVANVANYVTYRGRSLLRDLGAVLGVDAPEIERLRDLLWHSRGDDLEEKLESQPELRALGIDASRYADLFALCAHLAGNPRHLGTHSSGLVVADEPLENIVPLQWAAKGVTVATLDKDDVESPGIGLLKMDQLSLRALTAVDIAVAGLQAADPGFDYAGRDREDAETLALIRAAETVGVFQLESPAQMALQWRLQADRFDDLVASVALIRPGPVVGHSVEPFIRGRKGWMPVTYPLPELEPVLRDTYGRILFQDQVLDVVRIVGGFSANEADAWQKAMTHARSEDEMARLGLDLLERARPKGLTGKRFERLWTQIKGFSRYGFCHGHALAFADHAQGTAFLLRHHPAEFFAAILSVEPCGFWPISTVVAEAERRGVRVLGPCVNASGGERWHVESPSHSPRPTIRCSLARVREMHRLGRLVEKEREARGAFASLADFASRCPWLHREALEWLALSGSLDNLCPSRRQALWSIPSLRLANQKRPVETLPGQETLPLAVAPLLPPSLPDFDAGARFSRQWQAIGFSPGVHPMRAWRAELTERGVLPCATLQTQAAGSSVTVAGLALRPHRPPTPSGQVFVFLTLEDETGMTQVTIEPAVYERLGQNVFGHAALVVTGIAEPRGIGTILKATDVDFLETGAI